MSWVRLAIWRFAVVSPLRVLNQPDVMSVLAGPALANGSPSVSGSDSESPLGSLNATPVHGVGLVSSTAEAGVTEPATAVVVIAARASSGNRRVMGARTGAIPETGAKCNLARRLASLTRGARDRKSTRLNSSHANLPYAVFCFQKKT